MSREQPAIKAQLVAALEEAMRTVYTPPIVPNDPACCAAVLLARSADVVHVPLELVRLDLLALVVCARRVHLLESGDDDGAMRHESDFALAPAVQSKVCDRTVEGPAPRLLVVAGHGLRQRALARGIFAVLRRCLELSSNIKLLDHGVVESAVD